MLVTTCLAQHVVQRAKNAANTSVLGMIAKGSGMNVNLTIFTIIFITIILAIVNIIVNLTIFIIILIIIILIIITINPSN